MIDQLPHESIVYVGDTARRPYGSKPIGEVREYALECLDHLVALGVKGVGHRLQLRECGDAPRRAGALRRPGGRVILPATRRAVAASRTNRIGVICPGDRGSLAYDDAFAAAPPRPALDPGVPAPVDFVEAGVTGGEELIRVAHEYLDPLTTQGVDTVILGCTHYPLLTGVISTSWATTSRWSAARRRRQRTSTRCWCRPT